MNDLNTTSISLTVWQNLVRFRPLVLSVCWLVSFGLSSSIAEDSSPVNFMNDIMPVLTKTGCNSGPCHAKAGGGQNGFELSLLGFEPAEDYEHIVTESRGRRVFPAAPEHSLLLQKALGQLGHGGGVRMSAESAEYKVLLNWVEQGMPFQSVEDRQFVSIEVEPPAGTLPRQGTIQLKAIANYSDGSREDVTRLALFESNSDAMLQVDERGHVQAQNIPGRAAVMIRYQGKSALYTASIPLGDPLNAIPDGKNFIDEFVFKNLQQIGIPPSPDCGDSTFIRRVTLDITGRLPTEDEAEYFLSSTDPEKRNRLVEQLLRTPGYADYFANKWTTLLKNRRDDASDITSNFAFHAWIRDSLLANVPFDQFVRELLAATGTVVTNPPVAWYKRVKDPKDQLEDVAQLFLGVRLQCAQCHHHPFERWSQDDYYSLSAFFSQIGRKPTGIQGEDLIFHQRGVATATNVKTGEKLVPVALGDEVGQIGPDSDPRLKLADWMSNPENPFFAKAVVNRYWKHFFKRGLIEPEDDIRDTNPPTNPELLAALETHFINSGFDLKELVRVITQSQAYQLSSQPNEQNLIDEQNYSRYYPRRLPAEVLLDAVDDLTGNRTSFSNLPVGTRAVALPDNSYNNAVPFLRVFGRPENTSVCECERVQTSSLAQSLHLINSSEVSNKLKSGSGRAVMLAKADQPLEEKINKVFQVAYSRLPTEQELETAIAYMNNPVLDEAGQPIDPQPTKEQNFQDLLWSIMNSKEFLFNH